MGSITTTDIPFSVKPYSSPLVSLGTEIVQNCFVEVCSSPTAKSKYIYIGIPGLSLFKASSASQFSATSACRGLWTTSNNHTYGVFGYYVVEILSTGAFLLVGELSTGSGIVRFADNSETILIVDGKYGYTLTVNDNILAQIIDDNFPGAQDGVNGPTHCACIDTYFIVNSSNTNQYYWSAPGYQPYAFDSTKPGVLSLWNALDYGEKKGDSDTIIGLIQTVNLLWVFGQQSVEIHRNVGAGDDASGQLFGRMDGCFLNFGCSAPDSLCKYGNRIFFIGSDKTGTVGIFSADSSFQPERISTRYVEQDIQSYSQISDCYAYVHSFNGHSFVVFQFPHGTADTDQTEVNGSTWVYDITNDTWTRRSYWDKSSGTTSMWRGTFCTYNFGKVILGDRYTNALYYLDSSKYENDDPDGNGTNMIERIVTSPIGYQAGKNVVYYSVQLQLQPGQGLTNNNTAGIGADPKVGYSYSNDSGFSWSNERLKSYGMVGQYAYRCRWVKCGIGRNRVHKFRITDPTYVAIIALTVSIEVLKA